MDVLRIIYYILMGSSLICSIVSVIVVISNPDTDKGSKIMVVGIVLLVIGTIINLIMCAVEYTALSDSLRYICPLCDEHIGSLFCPECGTKATLDQLNIN